MQPEGLVKERSARSQPRLLAISSMARGKHPDPGIQTMPYVWTNLVEGPPPRRKTKGEGSHATYHGTEGAEDIRISYTTLVSVDPGYDLDSPDDDIIHVDVRVTVQRRALQELIDRERAFSDRWAARARASLAQRLVRQRVAANQLKAKWAIAAAVYLIRLQAKVGYSRIRLTRRVLRGAVEVPDRLVTRTQTAMTHLGDKYGRRTMMAGLKDPSVLNNEQKGVVFFMSLAILVTLILLASNVFAFFYPSGSTVYKRMVADGAVSILSILGLPFPNEIVLINSTLAAGPVVAFAGSFLGKMIGVWLLFFLGDSLYDTIRRATTGKPRMARVVQWMNANANKWGFWLLIPVNMLPFVPDILLYVFAVSGMRYRPYMLGIMIGTVAKFLAVVLAVVFIGPDHVREFFTNPFG